MKKLIFIPASILLFCICFTGCFKYNEADFLCDCGKIEINKKEYIAMCVLPQEVTNNSSNKLRMENHTKQNMDYGYDFSLEYLYENNWELVPTDLVTPAIQLYLSARETAERVMNLYSLAEKYNDSKKGKYRIMKKIGKYDLVAEFEVK